jgi:hypothetical protein
MWDRRAWGEIATHGRAGGMVGERLQYGEKPAAGSVLAGPDMPLPFP